MDDETQQHLHVGLDVPRTGGGKGKETFAPGQFKAGCCVANEKCIIAVHGVVEESICAAHGSCATAT